MKRQCTNQVFRAVLVCAYLLTATYTATGQHVPKLSVQNHKSEIDKLMALSTGTAKKQAAGDLDAKAIAAKCADELEKVRNYGSVAKMLDRENKELRSHEAVGVSLTFDYVAPDRYHFVQNVWAGGPTYDFDEWVTIGDSYYAFSAIWREGIEKALVPTGYDPRRTNRAWGLQKYLGVLRSENPVSGDLYLYDGKPYYELVYIFPSSRHRGFPTFGASGSVALHLWVDPRTNLLARADSMSASEKPGKPPRRELQQVFVAYPGNIRIDPPVKVCRKDHAAMCFVFIALTPSATAEKPGAESKGLSYSNPDYGWSVSYPRTWTIDSKENYVRISSPAGEGLCGVYSVRTDRVKTADELADLRQKQDEKDQFATSHSPKQRISLPNEVTGVDVVIEIRGGGRSRRIYIVNDGVGYIVDCETHGSMWANLEPSFTQIIKSFTLQRKP